MVVRAPARAGEFYDADPEELRETVEACFLGPYGPGRLPAPAPFRTGDIVALVCPHAGLKFSGYAAAAAYAELAEDGLPDTVALLGPNHFGVGAPAAIMTSGEWQTPLGTLEVNTEIAEKILEESEYLRDDPVAHWKEHSLEVQLPFLQYLGGSKISIVPIVIAHLSREDARLLVEDLGDAMGKALADTESVIVASTDFTHYERKSRAERQDKMAIDEIRKLDWSQLLDVVQRQDISMCGAVPTSVAIRAGKMLGATRADLLKYYTSGDIIGDTSQVVGYGSLKVVRGE